MQARLCLPRKRIIHSTDYAPLCLTRFGDAFFIRIKDIAIRLDIVNAMKLEHATTPPMQRRSYLERAEWRDRRIGTRRVGLYWCNRDDGYRELYAPHVRRIILDASDADELSRRITNLRLPRVTVGA